MKKINPQHLLPFIQYRTSRSGGSGGQHVNKVETKVILLFDIDSADLFSPTEKEQLKFRLQNRLQTNGLIQVTSQETRSQLENKQIALQKLTALLVSALQVAKPRKTTKPSKSAVQKRLDTKRKQALRKISRKKDWL